MGIATRSTNLNKVPLGDDAQSWVLCSDGAVRHNGEEKYKIADIPQEGDILVRERERERERERMRMIM